MTDTDTNVQTTTEVTAEPKSLEDMTVREVQQLLVNEFDFVGVEALVTKKQVVTVLTAMRERAEKEEKKIDEMLNSAEFKTVKGKDKDGKEVDLVVDPTAPRPEDKANARVEEKLYEGKKARMKARLAMQPKVMINIPLEFKEKRGAYETVILNGYRLNIMKGVTVEVPKQIADILSESYKLTAEAGQDFSLDRSELVKEAL